MRSWIKRAIFRLAKAPKPQPTQHARAENACILCRAARRKSHALWINLLEVNEEFGDKHNDKRAFLVSFFFYIRHKSALEHLPHPIHGGYKGIGLLQRIVQSKRGAYGAIVPLPLSKKKKRQRGYNQCDYIAEGLSQISGIPVVKDCVVRTKANESQTHKTRDERWKNTEGIFSLANPEPIEGKHILLIDDILTTGATLTNCAMAIQQTCHCKISIFTLAYTYNKL